MSGNYLGVTISVNGEGWTIAEIPLYCHVGPKQNYPHAQNFQRVEFLTAQRNQAMDAALRLFPGTTHILNIESNYLSQTRSIQKLVERYEELDSDIILGASTWAKMQDRFPTYYQFYDAWATPELYYYKYYRHPPGGLAQVSSVGSCLIFPAEVWRKHGFGVPEPFPQAGIYYNWLCERSVLPVLMDFDIRFYRTCRNSDLVPCLSPWKRVNGTAKKLIRTRFLGVRLSS